MSIDQVSTYEVDEMFDWNDRDTKFVYRVRVAVILLLFIPLWGAFIFVAYMSLLDPLVFPLGGYFYLLSYSFGLRLVYLGETFILSTHFVVSPSRCFWWLFSLLLACYILLCAGILTSFGF
jgi:hypothetical protein